MCSVIYRFSIEYDVLVASEALQVVQLVPDSLTLLSADITSPGSEHAHMRVNRKNYDTQLCNAILQ